MRYPSLAVPDWHPDLKLTLPTLKVKMITLLVKLPYFRAFKFPTLFVAGDSERDFLFGNIWKLGEAMGGR